MSEKSTSRQNWALFCATGCDVRNINLSREQASEFIKLANQDKESVVEKLVSMGAEQKRKASSSKKEDFQELFNKADKAGMEAVESLNVTPMVVQSHANPLDDNSPVTESYYIPDGPCGFAWVKIRPARGKFVNWLKKQEIGRTDSYAGGYVIWVSKFNQSMQKKECYARAFANVLKESGIDAYSQSRMD